MRYAMIAILGAAAVAAAVSAAPILGRTPDQPGEVLSMAEMKTVTIDVTAVPQTLRGRRITKERMKKVFREELEAMGIQVENKRLANVPHLVLSVRGATDSLQPNAIALYTLIGARQDVELKRLGKPMRVMTHITVDVHLTTVDRAHSEVEARVRHAVQVNGRIIAQATSDLHDQDTP